MTLREDLFDWLSAQAPWQQTLARQSDGLPCIRDTRVAVSAVLGLLAAAGTNELPADEVMHPLGYV
jgi:uncharacterized protein (DUF433 family)